MLSFTILSIYRSIVSIIVITMGAFVFQKNKNHQASRLFFLFCITNGLGILSLNLFEIMMMVFQYYSPTILYFQSFFGSIGALLWFLFAKNYTENTKKIKSKWKYLLYLPTLFFILAPIKYPLFSSVFIKNSTLYKKRTLLYLLFSVYSLLCVLIANVTLWIKFKQSKSAVQKNQIKLLVIGGAIGGGIVITDFLLAYSGHTFHLMHIGFLTFVFFSAYSILKYRAFDIKSAFHFGLLWLLSRIAVVLPIIFIPYFFPNVFHQTQLPTHIVVSVYCCISLLYFVLCQKILFLKIDRYLLRKKLFLEKASIQFSEKLYSVRNQKDLFAIVFNTITQFVYASEILLFIPEKIQHCFTRYSSCRTDGSSQMVLFPNKIPHIVFRQQIPLYTPKELNEEGIKVICQINDGEELLGFLCLKEKKNYAEYSDAEIEFISVVSKTIALSLKALNFHSQNQELNASLLNATKAKSFLKEAFDGVSHELKTAFYSSSGIKNMVLNGEVRGEEELRKVYLETVTFGEYIFHMVRNYGLSEKIEYGNITVCPSFVTIKSILDIVLQLNDYYVKDKNLTIKVSGDWNRVIYIDKEKITTILSNIINNAIKYSHNDSLIKISLLNEESTLTIIVEDFGVGISKLLLETIFDKTKNQKVTRGNNYFSLGLGLPLSRALTEFIQGQIKVSSEEGKGTVVTIILPLNYVNLEGDSNA